MGDFSFTLQCFFPVSASMLKRSPVRVPKKRDDPSVAKVDCATLLRTNV